MNRDDWRQWCYRCMAIKDDPGFWVQTHPRLGRAIEVLYDKVEPVREHFRALAEASYTDRKIQAIRDVWGDRSIEVKYWKHDGSAEDTYAEADRQGIQYVRNSVKPYTRRELRVERLERWGLDADALSTKTDAEIDAIFEREVVLRRAR